MRGQMISSTCAHFTEIKSFKFPNWLRLPDVSAQTTLCSPHAPITARSTHRTLHSPHASAHLRSPLIPRLRSPHASAHSSLRSPPRLRSPTPPLTHASAHPCPCSPYAHPLCWLFCICIYYLLLLTDFTNGSFRFSSFLCSMHELF
jgi:hypothetical protein